MRKILLLIIITIILIPNANAFNLEKKSSTEISSEEDTERGCVFEGEGDKYWYLWRERASDFFHEILDTNPWVVKCPSIRDISYNIKDLEVDYFYVIAHSDGSSSRFRTSGPGVHYTADQLHEDMLNRPAIKLAILCCCEAMTDTGPGTLSYEFRKGQTEGTAVIGYNNLSKHKDNGDLMLDLLDWQDLFFKYLKRGYTVKKAFDKSCNQIEFRLPYIRECVKFEGDEKLKMKCNFKVKPNSKFNNFSNIFLNLLKYFNAEDLRILKFNIFNHGNYQIK